MSSALSAGTSNKSLTSAMAARSLVKHRSREAQGSSDPRRRLARLSPEKWFLGSCRAAESPCDLLPQTRLAPGLAGFFVRVLVSVADRDLFFLDLQILPPKERTLAFPARKSGVGADNPGAE